MSTNGIRGRLVDSKAASMTFYGKDDSETRISGGGKYKKRFALEDVDHSSVNVRCRVLEEGKSAKSSWWRKLFNLDEVHFEVIAKDDKGNDQKVRIAVSVGSLAKRWLLSKNEIRKKFAKGELLPFLSDHAREVSRRHLWDTPRVRKQFRDKKLLNVHEVARKAFDSKGFTALFDFSSSSTGERSRGVLVKSLGNRIVIGDVDSELGRGAFGKVSEVVYGSRVLSDALKEMTVSADQSPEERAEAVREERGILEFLDGKRRESGRDDLGIPEPPKVVKHFNVVKGVISEDDNEGLLMKIQGTAVDFTGKFRIDRLAEDICFMHECGVVHRDLKPANLFYDLPAIGDRSPRAILPGDFGESVRVDSILEMMDSEDSEIVMSKMAVGSPNFFRGLISIVIGESGDQYRAENVVLDNSDYGLLLDAVEDGDKDLVRKRLYAADTYAFALSIIDMLKNVRPVNLEYLIYKENPIHPNTLKWLLSFAFEKNPDDTWKYSVDEAIGKLDTAFEGRFAIAKDGLDYKLCKAMLGSVRLRKLSYVDVCKMVDGLVQGKSWGEISLSFVTDDDFVKRGLSPKLRPIFQKAVVANPDDRCSMQDIVDALHTM